jgi:hypothetical protein
MMNKYGAQPPSAVAVAAVALRSKDDAGGGSKWTQSLQEII